MMAAVFFRRFGALLILAATAMNTHSALAARWQRLTTPLLPDAARREVAFQKLVAAYEAAGRHYHTLAHIEHLLRRLEALPLHDAPVVELAVWFHDAVYNPLKSDNEAHSAALALDFLRHSTLEPARQQRVAYLIERTHDHTRDLFPCAREIAAQQGGEIGQVLLEQRLVLQHVARVDDRTVEDRLGHQRDADRGAEAGDGGGGEAGGAGVGPVLERA